MENPKLTPTTPATPAPTPVPEGIMRIEVPEEKKLKKSVVNQYTSGQIASTAKHAFGGEEPNSMILALFVNPVTGVSTVVYGLLE